MADAEEHKQPSTTGSPLPSGWRTASFLLQILVNSLAGVANGVHQVVTRDDAHQLAVAQYGQPAHVFLRGTCRRP